MTHTRYIWDQDVLLSEIVDDKLAKMITNLSVYPGHPISIRTDSDTAFIEYDAVGSAVMLTNLAGSITSTRVFSAFGNVIVLSPDVLIEHGFMAADDYYSEAILGSIVARRRFFLPVAARWSSTDPLGFADTENYYTMARNNPVTLHDPSGLLTVYGDIFQKVCHCGDAAVNWVFEQNWSEKPLFIVQKVCETIFIRRCERRCGCTPDETIVCHKCFWELLTSTKESGLQKGKPKVVDKWMFPHVFRVGHCVSAGVAIRSADIRATTDERVVSSPKWKGGPAKIWCGKLFNTVGMHFETEPHWWNNPVWQDRALSFFMTWWNCCNDNKDKNFGHASWFTLGTEGNRSDHILCDPEFESNV